VSDALAVEVRGLVNPTAGEARVAGFDVVKQRDLVRQNIGLVFQDTTLDNYLTGEPSTLASRGAAGRCRTACRSASSRCSASSRSDWPSRSSARPSSRHRPTANRESIGQTKPKSCLKTTKSRVVPKFSVPKQKSDAGWLRGQTTLRRNHRRSDGGPERREGCSDGGSEHRYE
jgi:hypothetical protein